MEDGDHGEYVQIHGVLRAWGNDGGKESLNSKQYGTDWKKEGREGKDTAQEAGKVLSRMGRAQGQDGETGAQQRVGKS